MTSDKIAKTPAGSLSPARNRARMKSSCRLLRCRETLRCFGNRPRASSEPFARKRQDSCPKAAAVRVGNVGGVGPGNALCPKETLVTPLLPAQTLTVSMVD